MRLFQPTYSNASGKAKRSKTWRVRFSIAGRRFDLPTGLRDRRAAELKARAIVKDSELKAAGLNLFGESRDLRLSDVAAQFEAELIRRGRTAQYAAETRGRIGRLLGEASPLSTVTTERVRAALAKLAASKTPRTVGQHRQSAFALFRWLVEESRWPANPCAAVASIKQAEPTRRRRALDADELARLIAAAPPERATVYAVAAATGLRRSELAALRAADLDLDGSKPTVRVRAATAKNRREAILPLPSHAVAALRNALQRAGDAPTLLGRIPPMKALRRDLRAARAAWLAQEGIGDDERERRERSDFLKATDSEGRVVDFHALRVTYCTSLARAGVSLVVAQRLMRHSDPKLTANTYTRLEALDLHRAVAALESPSPLPSPKPAISHPDEAQPLRESATRATAPGAAKARQPRGKSARVARSGSGTPGGTRTPNRRIRNPMLYPIELPGRVGNPAF